MLLRSFTVQGSWNYETLIGTGFAFTLLPALRTFHPDGGAALREAVVRHATLFNSHPYLATVAVGAVARLEADGADPGLVERFKSALRGSLGSLGDQLVWRAWRPATVLFGLVLMLAGGAWWLGVSVFLVLHNALHLALRLWGLRVGLGSGLEVARVLREAPLQRLGARASDAGAFLSGLAVALLVAPLRHEPLVLSAALLAVPLGLWLGLRARRWMSVLVGVSWLLAILLESVL